MSMGKRLARTATAPQENQPQNMVPSAEWGLVLRSTPECDLKQTENAPNCLGIHLILLLAAKKAVSPPSTLLGMSDRSRLVELFPFHFLRSIR